MIPRLTEPCREPRPIPWAHLFAILLFALGLRVVALTRSDAIGTDSYRFLAAAQCIEKGDWSGALHDAYHPLTATLIAGVNTTQAWLLGPIDPSDPESFATDQRRRERAGWLISLISGLALVWLSIDLARRLFPDVSPIGVGLLTAVQPYFVRASGDIMSDAIYLTLFAFGLRAAVLALDGAKWSPFVAVGLSAGLAYLTRPEGLLLIPAVGGVWLFCRPWPWRVLMSRSAVSAGMASVCIVPYIMALGGRLTEKKDVGDMIGLPTDAAGVMPGGMIAVGDSSLALASLNELFKEWFSTAPELVGVAAIVGALAILRGPRRRDVGPLLYLGLSFAMALILLRLLISVGEPGYVSRRHVFLLVLLSLPFAAKGIALAASGIAYFLPESKRRFVFPILASMVIAALVPKALAAHRADQVTQRWAAEYIVAHGGTGQRVFSSREKVGYYAGARLVPLEAGLTEYRFDQLEKSDRAWLAFYRERLSGRVPKLDQLLGELGASLEHRATWAEPRSKRPRHLELYLYTKQGAGAAGH